METRSKSFMGTKLDTRTLVTMAMLATISFLVMYVGRIPVVSFLKYDPKDVFIVIGGFIYGPAAAAMISLVVSFVEMFSVSDTGIIGLIMNVLSTCTFACTAAAIYKRRPSLNSAVIGLVIGCIIMTGVMILWNYLITPVYMKVPRDVVVGMLLPVFLPFNLVKGGLNAAIAMLIYKPVSAILRRAHLAPESAGGGGFKLVVTAISGLALITFILLALVLKGVL